MRWFVLCLLLLTGCFKSPIEVLPLDRLKPKESPAEAPAAPTDNVEDAKAEMLRAKAEAAAAKDRYETLVAVNRQERLAAQAMWVTGIALLLSVVAGAAAFLLPIGKKTCVTVVIAGLTIAACAQAFSWAIPYLPWIGGAILLIAGFVAAVWGKQIAQAVRVSSEHGDRLENKIKADLLPEIPEQLRDRIEALLQQAKQETTQQAESLGVHGTMQFLRGKTNKATGQK